MASRAPKRKRVRRRIPPKPAAAPAAEPRPDAWGESLLVGRVKDLADVGLRLDRAAREDELLDLLRKEARWLVEHDRAFAVLLMEDRKGTVFHDLSAGAPFEKLHGKVFPSAEGMAGWVVRHSAPIFVRIDACPSFSPAVEGVLAAAGIASLLVLPLRTGGDTLGALLFCSAHPAAYNDPDMWVAQILAHHVARSLRSLRLREADGRRVATIDAFVRAAEAIRGATGEQGILDAAARALTEQFGFHTAAVYVPSTKSQEAVRLSSSGSGGGAPAAPGTVPLLGSAAGAVLAGRTPVAMNDAPREALPFGSAGGGFRSVLAVPLPFEGESNAVLVAGDPAAGAYDAGDLALLQAVAGEVSASVRNARLLERVRGTNAQLLELDRMKSDFISIVSHDFRSPLASIILAAKGLERLEPGAGQPAVLEHMAIIIDQATRLSQLAEDTLSITRIESGQLTYYFAIVDLGRVIADAIAAVPAGGRHTIDVAVAPGASRVKADASKVRQVVQNLISNAIRYSPAGGRVRIAAVDAGKEDVEVSVSDEGVGIPADQMDRLFRKFSRVETPASRSIKGSGLGLWICREIVNAHGGRIWAERNAGRGTTFRFLLQKP